MAYGQNMNAPNSGIASLMAMRGREGDNTLVHVNPMELKTLNMMAPGGLTQNPATGLPEAFKLKDLLPVIGAIAMPFAAPALLGGAAAAGGIGATLAGNTALMAGLGGAAGTALAGGNRKEILGSGLLSGVTAGLSGGFGSSASKVAAAKDAVAKEGFKQGALAGTELAQRVGQQTAGDLLGQTGTALGQKVAGEVGAHTLKSAGLAGLSAGLPSMGVFDMPEPTKGLKPIQSVKTAQQTPQVSREEIDEFIRKGGVLPPFFSPNPNVITPGIYRSEGGQTSGTEMFAGRVMSDEGDGMSDNVEFEVVGDPQIDTAMLSPDEHVISAAEVAAIGNGSTNVGHRRLEEFRKQLREARGFREEGPQEVDSDILDNLA